MRYQCPKCKSTELHVDVEVQARLYQLEDVAFYTDAGGADHEWDDTSTMYCNECDFIGEVHEFDTENAE